MKKNFQRWAWILGLASLIFVGGSLYQPTVVMGQSMEPTLHPKQVIWTDRTYYLTHRPQRGEVIVFKHEGLTYVKRIYREPGETLHYLSSDGMFINAVRENRLGYVQEMCRKLRTTYQITELKVPDDCVYVLGDNYFNSEDSRELGPIPISDIVGRAHLETDETHGAIYEEAPKMRPLAGRFLATGG